MSVFIFMNNKKADRIKQLRTGNLMHSWRRISEIICEEFPDENKELSGNQLHGIDLCKNAMLFLYNAKNINDIPNKIRALWDT